MNHGFVLNDGTSNIRSSYFPVSAVIVRDDPHYSREQMYTGNGTRLYDGSKRGASARGGRQPSRSALHENDDPSSASSAGSRRRPNAGGRKVPSYMAATASSERKHLPEGNFDDEYDQGSSYAMTDDNDRDGSLTVESFEATPYRNGAANSHPGGGSAVKSAARRSSRHVEVFREGPHYPDVAVATPARYHRTSTAATTEHASRSPPPPAAKASFGRAATSLPSTTNHPPVIISPLNSLARVTALPLADDDHDTALYDPDDDDGAAPTDSALVSADSSIAEAGDGDSALGSSQVSFPHRVVALTTSEEPEWRAFVVEEECEGWIEVMDAAMDEVADIMLARRDASTSPPLISPMSASTATLGDTTVGAVPIAGGAAKANRVGMDVSSPSATTNPVQVVATTEKSHMLTDTAEVGAYSTECGAPTSPSKTSACDGVATAVVGGPPASPLSSTKANAGDDIVAEDGDGTLTTTALVTAAPPTTTDVSVAADGDAPLSSLSYDGNPMPVGGGGGLAAPSDLNALAGALPPQLQQYLQALHFQTVMLSQEMRRVTESHATLSSELVSAQREIERMRGDHREQISVAVKREEDDAVGGHQDAQEGAVGQSEDAVGLSPTVPVHPTFVSESPSTLTALPGAPPQPDDSEGLDVEGAGNIAKSVYHLLAYPLQCCMRRPT